MAENTSIVVRVATSCEIWAGQEIIAGMKQQGFDLSLTSNGGLAVTPASRLDDHQRALIRDNRTAIMAHLTAANDPTAHPVIDIGTRRPPDLSPTLLAASLALDAEIAASGALPVDPDRHCYPHTQAANSTELALMATRLERFARIGMDVDQAEKLADRLKDRDRDPQDDRITCMECQHCQYGRCGNSRTAGLRYPELGTDYALVLKRCSGFAPGQGTLAGASLTFSSLPPSKPLPRPHQGHPLTPEQQQAGRSYHEHHFGCPKCRSGRGERCQRGTELWNAYTAGDGDGR